MLWLHTVTIENYSNLINLYTSAFNSSIKDSITDVNLSALFANHIESTKNIAFWGLLGLDLESFFLQGNLINYVNLKTEMFSQKNSHLPSENSTTIIDNVVFGAEKVYSVLIGVVWKGFVYNITK